MEFDKDIEKYFKKFDCGLYDIVDIKLKFQWMLEAKNKEIEGKDKKIEDLEYAVHLGDEVARKTHNIYREEVTTGETAFDRRLKEFRALAKKLIKDTRWDYSKR